MMRLQDAISRTTVELYEEIANSGEGRIFRTSRNGYLAKIYHSVDQEKINKLWVMMKHPPIDPAASRGHTSIAWPNALLEDDHGRCLGFLMPLIQDGQTLINVYNPEMRKKNAAGFNWLYLHTTALNIATVLQALHAYNYVVGDLKPENLLVNAKGLVSIIDTDSFQIIDPNTGKVYRSPVASPEYTPHEMFGKDFQVVDRSEVQDRFGLAVIIWLLLFGYHPFSGKWVGIGDQSNPDERIRNGHWMYGSTAMIRPGPSSMPLNILHPTLQLYFRQCFDNGHSNPNSRPSAAAWVKALSSAKENLRNCSFEQEHYYSQNYGKCYWCERKQLLNNYDIFPSTQSYRSSTPRVPSSTVNSPTPTPSRSFVNNKTRGQSLNKISLNKIKLSKAKGNGFLKALSVIAQFSGNYILPLAFNLLRSILKLSVWLVRRHLLATLLFLTILIISISCWHDQVRQAQLEAQLEVELDVSEINYPIFQETFTDIDSSKQLEEEEQWALPTGSEIKDGGLLQDGGKLGLQSNGQGYGVSAWDSCRFTDIVFSADVKKASGNDNVPFGLLIRAEWENEDWKGYFLRIEDDGDVTMGIRDDVGWNTRETGNADRYRPGQPNRLGIAAKGNLIIGFVNDQRVGFFRDDSLKLGEIGLVSERIGDEAVVVYFDNLEVKVRQEDDCIKGGENL